ncbi:hypothetical protein BD779DRAFT_1607792 [Infundibulicybe gibba]|nr:hypothetical protein BD779DRAFT_1607792 [Infundibulicybe gibba]
MIWQLQNDVPQRAPSRVPQLPLELVLAIVEAAYYTDALEPNDRLLQDCSLVCKRWSLPVQKLLFTRVTLRSGPACNAFQAAVDRSTERGRALGDSVVRLRVIMDNNQPFSLPESSFARAVLLCPRLYELDLALYGCATPGEDVVGAPDLARMRRPAPLFDQSTLASLRSGPNITALRFDNWSENQSSIIQLLDVWTTLKSLTISGTPPQLPSITHQPFPCSLEQLRVNFQTPPSIDFMKWLLHNSAQTLRVLELEREPPAHFLDFLVASHSQSLSSLSLPACQLQEHVSAIHKCTRLQEIKLEHPWTSPLIYRKLPSTLQHLAFSIDKDTALQPVLETIKTRPSLSVISVHVWAGGEAHTQLPALKIACAFRGITLRITHDIALFRSMMRGDPVLFETYPRVKSTATLNLMRD